MSKDAHSTLVAAAAPATFALSAGLGWSLYDAFHLTGSQTPFWRAWALAAAAACLAALVVVPAAIGLQVLWSHPRAGGRLRDAVCENPAKAATYFNLSVIALGLLATGTFVVQSTARLLFGSDMVRLLATTGLVPAMAALVALLGWWVSPVVVRRMEGLESARALAIVSVGLPVGLGVAAAVAFPIIAPSVWEQLSPESYLAIPIISLGALVGVFVGDRRRLIALSTAAAAATLVLAVVHLATPAPQELRRTLEVRPSGTATVLAMIPTGQAPRSTHVGAGGDGRSASCFPGVEPLRADQIGAVDDDAPDIIFVTVDALRWDHTTLGGYEHETTPNLARHAQDAAVFEQAYSPASNTRQAFRGFFTGIYPSLVEAPSTPGAPWATSFAEGQETMAGYLSAAGYQTIALSSRDRAFPAHHGALNGFEVIDETPIPLELDQGHSVSYKMDRIIAHLSELDEERPRFIWTHLMEVHSPYPAGPDPKRFDTGPYRRYNSAIHFVDRELKRLLDFARGPTRIDNTIVVLTADHGEAFKEHDNRLHGSTTYQEEIHVPLIFWGPDVKAQRISAPAVGTDILPTLLGWLGLEVPEALCGDDLSAAVRGDDEPPQTPAYIENIPDDTRDYFSVSFIEGSEKLLLFPSREVAELYDLAADPKERHNLAESSPQKLRGRLDALRHFYEERGMDPNFYSLDAIYEALP